MAASPSHLLFPRLFRPSSPVLSPFSPLFLKPLTVATTTTALCLQRHSSSLHLSSLLHSSGLLSFSISTAPFSPFLCHNVVSAPCSLPPELQSVGEVEVEDYGEEGAEDGVVDESEVEETEVDGGRESAARVLSVVEKRSVPQLTVKEKKELASYAHSLGDKIKSQQVGKSGVTGNVVMAFNETLEANELLKLKIHRTCPGEFDDIVKQLEQYTGSLAVSQIGRMVIFYRPSVSKLKVEEKRKQARKVFVQRKLKSRPAIQRSEQGLREYGRGRRGSSRFSSSTRSDQ